MESTVSTVPNITTDQPGPAVDVAISPPYVCNFQNRNKKDDVGEKRKGKEGRGEEKGVTNNANVDLVQYRSGENENIEFTFLP